MTAGPGAQQAAPGFCCPVCGLPLAKAQNTLRCPGGHSFDRAKEGYVNLLLASRMRTKAPGDSKEMVQARHAFLQSGAYAPFAGALAQLCCGFARGANRPLRIADAGCGEGYYAQVVSEALCSRGLPYALAGWDIAKPAVRLAARRDLPGAAFAVASSFAAPLADGWADVLLNVFSPFARAEFLRCLAPGAKLIYAVPTADHLMGLKQVLYSRPYENPVRRVEYAGFCQQDELVVRDTLHLAGAAVGQLFSMTPYYWKTPADGAARLAELDRLDTPVGFRFLVFEKTG